MANHENHDDDSWWQLAFFGVLLVLTPIVQMIRAGVRSDSDMIQWIMSKPLGFHTMVRASILSGIGFIFLGVVLFYIGKL
jgi:hypothetical protein